MKITFEIPKLMIPLKFVTVIVLAISESLAHESLCNIPKGQPTIWTRCSLPRLGSGVRIRYLVFRMLRNQNAIKCYLKSLNAGSL